MRSRIRVLIVDNLAVESSKRSFHRALANTPELEVHVLTPRQWQEAGEVVECEPEQGLLRLHTTEVFFKYRQHRVLYRRLGHLLREIQPHFFFSDAEPENYAGLQSLLATRMFSPRTKLALVSSRNLDHPRIGFPYKLSFTHRLCDSIIRRFPVDVCFLRTVAGMELMAPYARRVVYLPFPVDCAEFKPRSVKAIQFIASNEVLTIGYVGRLIEEKGVLLLLNALPQLPVNVRLVFAGKGILAEELQRRAIALRVSDRVSVLPAVAHADVPKILSEMDIVVVPSFDTPRWKEQCPRIPMEAMACQIAVVGSNSGGIPEVVGDAGLIFEQGNLAQLVDRLRILINNPMFCEKLAERGRARVLQHFETSKVAARMSSEILQLMA